MLNYAHMKFGDFEMDSVSKTSKQGIEGGSFNWRDSAPEWFRTALNGPRADNLSAEVTKLDDVAALALESGIQFENDDDIDESSWRWQVEEGLITQNQMDYHLENAKKYGTAYAKMISWGRSQGLLTNDEAESFLGQL